MPIYAFLDPESISQILLKTLAVGGGFLVGYLVTWVLARLVDRWTFGGRAPEQLHMAARIIGGLAVALVVALILFGSGAGGFGFGGGPGQGGPPESLKGTSEAEKQDANPHVDTIPDPPASSKESVPPEQRVRVTLLGGEDVREEKFYLLNDERTPVDLAGLTAALKSRKESAARPIGLEVRFAPNNTLPRTHPAVLRLTSWAQANGYSVTFPAK